MVRRKGLATLWCLRRQAAAEQMSTGHLYLMVRVPPGIKNVGYPNGYPTFLGITNRFNRVPQDGVHLTLGWGAFYLPWGANGVQPSNRVGYIHLRLGCKFPPRGAFTRG